jgi:hypothetical protein
LDGTCGFSIELTKMRWIILIQQRTLLLTLQCSGHNVGDGELKLHIAHCWVISPKLCDGGILVTNRTCCRPVHCQHKCAMGNLNSPSHSGWPAPLQVCDGEC